MISPRFAPQTSTAQMAVMLLFNTSVEYSIGELVDSLKLRKDVLVQVVQALVKFQLLELTLTVRFSVVFWVITSYL